MYRVYFIVQQAKKCHIDIYRWHKMMTHTDSIVVDSWFCTTAEAFIFVVCFWWLGMILVLMFNATFNGFSIILWQWVLLAEESRIYGENLQVKLFHIKLYRIHFVTDRNLTQNFSDCIRQMKFRLPIDCHNDDPQ
jgi:hypothetical protein